MFWFERVLSSRTWNGTVTSTPLTQNGSATTLATAASQEWPPNPAVFTAKRLCNEIKGAGLWEPCRMTMVHRTDCSHGKCCPPDYTTANSERRSFDVGFAALSAACHSMP